MSSKLHYFNINILAEPIRYILHYSGKKFEDIRYEVKDWPIKEVKDRLPYGQLPFYEEGSRILNQSLAIARYVASKTDLLPSDPWDQAVLDAAVLNVYDFWNTREQDPEKKEALKKTFLSESVEFYLSRFEKELSNNNGHFGGKLSWADFVLVGIVEAANLVFNTEIEKNYPTVQALVQEIRNLPGVKEYIAKRPPYRI
ncbi:glutathione S-transferase-like isoform X2 [Hyposmocoma kahamanoa]|uniref:glutathione S-transferase-like isoform X2 n=1 Tax=Hyposmocoma kahamanoa TaxID=1477025 RepID=UPI000E6D7F4A|nr:glutathione S-transferase-like isoform X2 [Hyposmocoma kahamanoa]